LSETLCCHQGGVVPVAACKPHPLLRPGDERLLSDLAFLGDDMDGNPHHKLGDTKLDLIIAAMLFHLHFWETEEACDWLLCRTMRLDTLQPFTRKWRIFVYKVGAYENGNVIFLAMGSNNFIFYLDSMYLEELSTVGPMS
jgi:hypothetical protein